MPNEYEYEYFKVSFPSENVALVEIDRPGKLNAFIEIMWQNMKQIFDRMSQDPDIRAIVLSSTGDKAFTSGLDVQAAAQGGVMNGGPTDAARRANNIRRNILAFQDCVTAAEKCEKPIIVVYHAYSFGLAIDLGTATDVRICAANVQFSVKEVDIGMAADVGTLTRLPKVVGNFSWVKDVCLTARVFGAEEALKAGFVSEIAQSKGAAVQSAVEKATLIASKSPVATMSTKELLNWSRDRPVEDGLRYTSIWNGAMIQSQDVKDAMLSGLQKKKPTFAKL